MGQRARSDPSHQQHSLLTGHHVPPPAVEQIPPLSGAPAAHLSSMDCESPAGSSSRAPPPAHQAHRHGGSSSRLPVHHGQQQPHLHQVAAAYMPPPSSSSSSSSLSSTVILGAAPPSTSLYDPHLPPHLRSAPHMSPQQMLLSSPPSSSLHHHLPGASSSSHPPAHQYPVDLSALHPHPGLTSYIAPAATVGYPSQYWPQAASYLSHPLGTQLAPSHESRSSQQTRSHSSQDQRGDESPMVGVCVASH